jgi:GWxTD domain-containing protein
MMVSTRLAPAVLLLAAGLTMASGLATMSSGDIRFGIDTAVFSLYPGSDTLALEVYQEIDVEQFAHDGAGLSLVMTEVFLLDAGGDTTVIQGWNSEIEWIEGRSIVNGTILPAVPGEYVLLVTVIDMGNGRQGTVERELEIETPEVASQIELARQVIPAQEESMNLLRKGGMIVYPAADSRFDLPDESLAYVYLELYNSGGQSFSRQSRFVGPAGQTLFAKPWDTLLIPENALGVGILDSLDLSAAPGSGLYRIEVLLVSGSDTLVVEKPLIISWTAPVQDPVEDPEREGDRCLDQLVLFLSEQESDIYERLDDDSRARFYDEFWSISPNERTGFESRCSSSSIFSFLGEEGWETDRGRIYVKYGIPDDREAVPLTSNQVPYEIWSYYAGGGDQFVFVDSDGSGNFMQVYSTIEGEISFDNWEEYLSPIGGSRPGSAM